MSADSQFPASYDSTTKIISAVVVLILTVAALAAKTVIVIAPLAAVLFFTYAYSPRGYSIADGSIAVLRMIGNVRIPLAGIREVRMATANDLAGCIRLFGSGGLFGYYGLFRTSKLGKSTWYVTSQRNAVVVTTDRKTILLSPDDPTAFVATIHTVAPSTAGAQSDGAFDSLLLASPPSSTLGRIIGLSVGLAAIAIAIAAMLYAPGPPAYTLAPDSLTIRDRFYPVTLHAESVDISHIRVVDIAGDPEWRPTLRTNGFANPHYHAGWFRVAGGQKVRMYRAEGKRLVLLPPKGNGSAVLLETADPDQFVRDLRGEWPEPS